MSMQQNIDFQTLPLCTTGQGNKCVWLSCAIIVHAHKVYKDIGHQSSESFSFSKAANTVEYIIHFWKAANTVEYIIYFLEGRNMVEYIIYFLRAANMVEYSPACFERRKCSRNHCKGCTIQIIDKVKIQIIWSKNKKNTAKKSNTLVKKFNNPDKKSNNPVKKLDDPVKILLFFSHVNVYFQVIPYIRVARTCIEPITHFLFL